MLLRASLELPIPAATAADRLNPMLRRHGLDALSDEAYGAGMGVLVDADPSGEPSKTVRVETLEPRALGTGVRIPFRWVAATEDGRPIPVLDADLDVAALDEQRCTLSISAAYTPALGQAH